MLEAKLPVSYRLRLLLPIALALTIVAWLALYVWSASPYARFLDHVGLASVPLHSTGDYVTLLVLFLAGWLLMIVAMMLPTSLPLVLVFDRMVQWHDNRRWLLGLLIAGYLVVWLSFGIAAHVGDWLLHRAIAQSLWLTLHPWVISVVIFLLAGIYQFTPLKHHCLKKCRSPLTFVMEHWHGRQPLREALALGIGHGLYCLGCCWSLMLLMFAVGMGNLGWMFVLGALMAVEKNAPWGRVLSQPLGIGLAVWAVGLMVLSIMG